MAKAVFHKNQRVFVKTVGTWAQIERVLPQWTKGVDEPIRVYYDVGMGREFRAEELSAEEKHQRAGHKGPSGYGIDGENWRVLRIKNRWSDEEDTSSHPNPGTFPVVVTEEQDWGGWRVPHAEYSRDPERLEFQAKVMSVSNRMLRVIKKLDTYVENNEADIDPEAYELAKDARAILRLVYSRDYMSAESQAPSRSEASSDKPNRADSIVRSNSAPKRPAALSAKALPNVPPPQPGRVMADEEMTQQLGKPGRITGAKIQPNESRAKTGANQNEPTVVVPVKALEGDNPAPAHAKSDIMSAEQKILSSLNRLTGAKDI